MWRTQKRTLSTTIQASAVGRKRAARFQPHINSWGVGTRVFNKAYKAHDPRYKDLVNFEYVRNANPELRRRQAEVRLAQGRHTLAEYWPEKSEGTENELASWKYLAPPLLPNYIPLPGRETDNQLRNLSESTDVTLPWYQELLDETMMKLQSSDEPISKNRIQALKRLASVGFVGEEGNHKTLLLKIMSRPLMEHRHDYFNDAVRVCALTIDIREIQDLLFQGQHLPMRVHYRDLVILYRQRTRVLNRLRSQNFDLYCKTMEILNIEHHQEPILKTVCRKHFTEHIIDMKLRTMNQIEQNIKNERKLKSRLDQICDRGEQIFKNEKGFIEETRNIRASISSNIGKMADRMTETESKCRSLALNEQMWTIFDKIHAQTSEFASFFENIDGQQSVFDKRIDEIESFKRKIKYYKSQENKSLRLLDEVEELVETINQWEIISPLVDKISSIGVELEEIISEQLIPKFNKIERETDKNQHTAWLEDFVKLQDEYEDLKSDLTIDLDNIDLKAGYDSIYAKSSILLDKAKTLAE